MLKVLGARGSVPMEGKKFEIYGGATSCFLIRADKEEIYLDAGSGIAIAKPEKDTRITLLLTHMHLDHLIGLPFFIALGEAGRSIDIYAKGRSGLKPKEAIDRLISPPFWPVKIEDYPADAKIKPLPEKKSFLIGEVKIEMLEGTHPGGSTIFRITYQGKSIVYATDFEPTSTSCEALVNFAMDCDLLLYDAQYKEEEYEKYKGYGHSTAEAGLKVADMAGAKKILFTHYAPWRNDEELKEIEENISAKRNDVIFAKIGDVVHL